MSFWDNISRSTLRDVAHAAGMRTSPALAVEDLEKHYGSTPGPEFIDEMWLVLRDGWLTRSAADRDAVVKGMLVKGRGNAESLRLSTRAGQIQYLKTLHRGRGLTEVVLPVFLASGAAERFQPVYSEPPASPQEQARRFEDALRAGLAALPLPRITSTPCLKTSSVARCPGPIRRPSSMLSRSTKVLRAFRDELVGLAEDVASSVATIRVATADLQGATGSGWFSGPGIIVTNHHVIDGVRPTLKVRLHGGHVIPGELVGSDRRTDLAVIRCDATGIRPLPLRKNAPSRSAMSCSRSAGFRFAHGPTFSMSCAAICSARTSPSRLSATVTRRTFPSGSRCSAPGPAVRYTCVGSG